jgi:hypothetical protein
MSWAWCWPCDTDFTGPEAVRDALAHTCDPRDVVMVALTQENDRHDRELARILLGIEERELAGV